jgi:urea carboxylase
MVAGNVWKVLVEPGQTVRAGQAIAIVESMKMEFEVLAPVAGLVAEVTAGPGRSVKSGDTILVLEDI